MAEHIMGKCTSQHVHDDELLTCTRDAHHEGVHLGVIAHDSHTGELVQWSEAQSYEANAPVDDLPIWYSALPLGSVVRIETRNGYSLEDVQLTGAVLDDHEQLSALRIDYRRSEDEVVHTLLPWSRVNSIEWGDDD